MAIQGTSGNDKLYFYGGTVDAYGGNDVITRSILSKYSHTWLGDLYETESIPTASHVTITGSTGDDVIQCDGSNDISAKTIDVIITDLENGDTLYNNYTNDNGLEKSTVGGNIVWTESGQGASMSLFIAVATVGLKYKMPVTKIQLILKEQTLLNSTIIESREMKLAQALVTAAFCPFMVTQMSDSEQTAEHLPLIVQPAH